MDLLGFRAKELDYKKDVESLGLRPERTRLQTCSLVFRQRHAMLNVHMLNKIMKYRLTLMLTISMIVIITIGLGKLELKSFNDKNLDRTFIGCYIDCSDTEPLDYEAILAEERSIQQKENRIAIAERREEARLAEAERKERLEKLRVKRLEEKKNHPMLASRGNEDAGQWIQFEATYYSAFCNTGCIGITALGWDVSNTIYHNGHRVIAVDPKVIPLGSLVQVRAPNETFYALAGDTGGDIKKYRIDILVESTKIAYELGRHPVQIRIIK